MKKKKHLYKQYIEREKKTKLSKTTEMKIKQENGRSKKKNTKETEKKDNSLTKNKK